MLYLKKVNEQDAQEEYVYITNLPANENGFTNRYYGVSEEDFMQKVLPEMIHFSNGVGLPEGFVPLAAENTGIETSSVTRSVPGYYKCTGSDVNIRSGPGTQYTIVGTLNYGTKVYVYSISNGWAKISLGGIYRYVSADYLREL